MTRSERGRKLWVGSAHFCEAPFEELVHLRRQEELGFVAHQVVVLCLRYILETLDEEQVLAIDSEGDVANCSVTEYRFDPSVGKAGKLVLVRYNYTVPLTDEAVPLTVAKDAPAGVRG